MAKSDRNQLSKVESISVSAFELGASDLLTADTHKAIRANRQYLRKLVDDLPDLSGLEGPEDVKKVLCDSFYQGSVYKQLRERYHAKIGHCEIAGVYCETFFPNDGVPPENRQRVLINLHGGGFESGARTNSHLESLPVAAVGRMKVVSVDYRMAPTHSFPAATDDLVAVYEVLLDSYDPENIGFFGASAGAELISQAMVRLQQKSLPLPGAVALFAGGATRFDIGDSNTIGRAITKAALGVDLPDTLKYYEGADLDSPEVSPSQSDYYMKNFPATLLASSTRDFALSQVAFTHRQLARLGVDVDLHIWEGLDHVFHYNPVLPETDELHRLTIDFFRQHLGEAPLASSGLVAAPDEAVS